MTRPTLRDLADCHEDIEVLAYAHDPNGSPRLNSGFREVAKIANVFAWLVTEIRAADRAAAFGPGVKDGYRTLRHSSDPGDLDARTRDAHAKALRNLFAGCRHELARVAAEMEQDAMDVGRYPTRSEQSEPVSGLG